MNVLDFPVREIRHENRQDHELFRFAAGLAETLLPAGYKEYRERVHRWREKLAAAGLELEHESKARRRADELLHDAKLMDQQLRQTEQERGWIRTTAL